MKAKILTTKDLGNLEWDFENVGYVYIKTTRLNLKGRRSNIYFFKLSVPSTEWNIFIEADNITDAKRELKNILKDQFQ